MNINEKEALEELRRLLRPGDKVYTFLRYTSPSGMTRHIGLLISHGQEIRDITRLAAHACDLKYDREAESIVVTGTGMDISYDVVDKLKKKLWPKGLGDAVKR